jgi:hypothetical protein
MNDASTIIEHEIQEDNVPPIQTNTPIGEQSIVQCGLALVQELFTTNSNYYKFQVSNHDEFKYDSSDSSVKLSVKHVKET